MQSLEVIEAVNAPAKKKREPVKLTVVTNSELQTLRDCPQKHDFRYRQRLRAFVEGRALAVGSITHGGMSAGINAGWGPDAMTRTIDERLALAKAAAVALIDAKFLEWAARVMQHGGAVDFAKLEGDAVDGAAMVKWMLENYFDSNTVDLQELRLVEAEVPFEVVVRDKLGRKTQLRYAGVRDAVFYDPRYNQLVLHEHKSVSDNPMDIAKRAEMDPQTCGYIYSLLEQHKRSVDAFRFTYVGDDGVRVPVPQDATVGRVAYNALKKKRPSTPKVNQDGSVSVAAIDTIPELYEAALVEQRDKRGKGITDKQWAKLEELKGRTASFFYRYEFHRTHDEIDRWRSDTFVDASRVRGAARDPALRTRNPGNCCMAWSMPCEYRAVCIDDSPAIRAQYRVAAEAHTEIREAEEEQVAAPAAAVAPF
jgi:hypothetical protein